MKKVYLFIPTLFFILSCSGDSERMESEEKLTINPRELELTVGENGFVSTNVQCTFSSENDKIATISSNGQIHAEGVGETNILAKSMTGQQQAICNVKVLWKYNYFDEPLFDFSLSISQVKAKETHHFEKESYYEDAYPLYAAHTVLYYSYYIMGEYTQLDYLFYGVAGNMYLIRFEFDAKYSEYVLKQMEERYGLPIVETTIKKIKMYTYKKNGYKVTIKANNEHFWAVTYEPAT